MNKTAAIAIVQGLLADARANKRRYILTFDGKSVHVAETTVVRDLKPFEVVVSSESSEIALGFDLARALAAPFVFTLTEHEKNLAAEGNKIGAIKAVRQRAIEEGFSMGLKDAKDLVDKIPCHRRADLNPAPGVPRCVLGYAWCRCS